MSETDTGYYFNRLAEIIRTHRTLVPRSEHIPKGMTFLSVEKTQCTWGTSNGDIFAASGELYVEENFWAPKLPTKTGTIIKVTRELSSRVDVSYYILMGGFLGGSWINIDNVDDEEDESILEDLEWEIVFQGIPQ